MHENSWIFEKDQSKFFGKRTKFEREARECHNGNGAVGDGSEIKGNYLEI